MEGDEGEEGGKGGATWEALHCCCVPTALESVVMFYPATNITSLAGLLIRTAHHYTGPTNANSSNKAKSR